MNMTRLNILGVAAVLVCLGSSTALAGGQLPQPQSTSNAPSVSQLPLLGGGSSRNKGRNHTVDEASEKSNDARLQGEALLKEGNTQLAIDSYKAALDITPTNGLAYQRLAEAYAATGKLEEASQAFHKVLVEGFGPGIGSGIGGSADIWAEYALVLVKTNHPTEATQMYNHGASMQDYEDSKNNGGKPFLKVLFPEVVLGNSLPEQVQYTPEHLQALADALLSYEEKGFGSNKEAIAHMQEAVKLYPDSAVVQYYLGETLPCRYYVVLYSPVKDKKALWAGYEEDKKAMVAAYQKAAELGDDATVAAAKERLTPFH